MRLSRRVQRRLNLCARCSLIDFYAALNSSRLDSPRPILELTLAEAKVQTECALCRLIFTQSEQQLRKWIESDSQRVRCSVTVQDWRFLKAKSYANGLPDARGGYQSLEIKIRGHEANGRHLPDVLNFDLLPQKTDPARVAYPLTVTRRLIPETFDRSNLRRWLDRDDQHEALDHSSIPRSLFALVTTGKFRVIDVASDKVVVRKRPVRYLALSYVWGRRTPAQSMACWLAMKGRHSISGLVNLPRCITDTINLVRSLGERYLWIDAICIRPEDTTDVIPCMGAIYGAAYLTIVAAHGEDANAGLGRLSGRPNEPERPIKLCGEFQDISLLAPRALSLDKRLTDTKWATRAWTFQEWHASKRTVVSTSDEVFFHSRTMDVREAYEVHFQPQSNCRPADLGPPNARMITIYGKFRGRPNEDTSYPSLVSEFTGRVSTYPGDRLDAFIGVLEQFEPDTGSVPPRPVLSGLSRDHFVQSLAWRSMSNSSLRRHAAVVRIPQDHRKTRYFPSWSWVSVSGQISICPTALKRDCEVMDEANVCCNLAGKPWATGPSACEGTPMLSVTLHLWTGIIGCKFQRRFPEKFEFNPDVHISKLGDTESYTVLQSLLYEMNASLSVHFDLDESCSTNKRHALHFLVPLGYSGGRTPFLIILKIGSYYERVGVLEIHDWISRNEFRLQHWLSEPQYIQMR